MKSKTLTALTLSSSVAFGAFASAAPADNPFSAKPLEGGYQLAQADKAKEAGCGAGKTMGGTCGGMKAGEGMCGGMKAGSGMCGMSMADANQDGKVSRAEADAHHAAMFKQMDTNKDGFIDTDEMMKMHHGNCGAGGKKSDGKCGEGKCGADMMKQGNTV
jgi:uncharacterized low-complexity protein